MISRCRGVLALAAVCVLAGCSLELGRSGDACRRTTECHTGLACVRGECSRDLGPIAEESTVPEIGEGTDGDEPGVMGGAGGAGAPAAGSGKAPAAGSGGG